ncbi:EthD family reductase [Lichenibacterium ramalinae]|nr:EthD family reductase [Lichenibacterium ramalinae]
MAANVTVLYPNTPGARFDMDYYLAHHMPMVMQRFGAHGMTGWRVVRFEGKPEQTPHGVMATLDFGSTEGIAAALAAEGGPVLADVPNFTDLRPTLMTGEVVGRV